MKKIITILLLLLFFNVFSNEKLFTQGNSFYNENDYQSAILSYQEILNQGTESPELYFNIGNCYFQLAKYEIAKSYFLKSISINPNLEISNININICNKKIVKNKQPLFFYEKWENIILNMFTLNYWIIFSLISIIMLFILTVFKLYYNRNIQTSILILILILTIILYSITRYKQQKIDIIFKEKNIELTNKKK